MVQIASKKEWRKRSKKPYLDSKQVDLMWQASYAKQAKNYDEVRFSGWKGNFATKRLESILLNTIDVNDQTKILDVATGTGIVTLILGQKGGKIIGIDLTEAMLREAQQKARQANFSNIWLEIANAKNLPFKDNSFDFIVSRRFFHLIPNHLRRPIIEEMIRVLKPNGYMVLEFANPFYGLLAELYRRWFANKNAIYIWPTQTKALFAGTKIVKKIGTYLPLTQRIMRLNPKLGEALLNLCAYFPFNHIASEIWYVCRSQPPFGSTLEI